MFLVILAHVSGLCDSDKLGLSFNAYLGLVTQGASVAFMFCSGMIATYLMQFSDDWPRIRLKMIKRGLFLIFVVHPVLSIVTYGYFENQQGLWHNLTHVYQITDTIGLCLIIAPTVIRATSHSARLFIIISLLIFAILTRIWWIPDSVIPSLAKVAFVGTDPGGNSMISVGWPLVPWLAIYLSGSFAGDMYTRIRSGLLPYVEASKRAWNRALLLAAVGVALSVFYVILKRSNPFGWDERLFLIIYPTRTTALLPCYLALVYAFMAYLANHVDGKSRYNVVYWGLSLLGRTSLFTFVTQFIIIWTIPALLGFKGTLGYLGFATMFSIGLLVSVTIAYPYGRFRGRVDANEYQLLVRDPSG